MHLDYSGEKSKLVWFAQLVKLLAVFLTGFGLIEDFLHLKLKWSAKMLLLSGKILLSVMTTSIAIKKSVTKSTDVWKTLFFWAIFLVTILYFYI